jgi:hypothetical protein
MIWFRPSVGETCPCTSVQHGTTETVSTYLNACVFSADVGSVRQCKISAKYGCSVTVALDCKGRPYLWCVYTRLHDVTSHKATVFSSFLLDSAECALQMCFLIWLIVYGFMYIVYWTVLFMFLSAQTLFSHKQNTSEPGLFWAAVSGCCLDEFCWRSAVETGERRELEQLIL